MVDPGSPVLAYVQLANDLARRIDAEELTGRLPPQRDLASEYGVAYGTVRRAMEVLRERGLVRVGSRPGDIRQDVINKRLRRR